MLKLCVVDLDYKLRYVFMFVLSAWSENENNKEKQAI